MILSPRWSCPAVCKAGGKIPIVFGGADSSRSAQLCLNNESIAPVAAPEHYHKKGKQAFKLVFNLPESLVPGLYDITLIRSNGKTLKEPSALWIPKHGSEAFSFVHVSDFHVIPPGCEKPEMRDAGLRRLLRHLRDEIKPDFIIDTGDVISRYGRAKKPLPQRVIRTQIRAAHKAFLGLGIPYFLTPGNHDMAFPNSRDYWKRLMGGEWADDLHDFAFTYRNIRFLALDRSVRYDKNNKAVSFRVPPAQKRRLLKEQADALTAGHPLVLFFHYDYTGELVALLKSPPIVQVLYGHTNHSCLPDSMRAVDGLLDSHLAYQRVSVRPDGNMRLRPGLQKECFLKK